jgi:NADPH-dependent F420 reductase
VTTVTIIGSGNMARGIATRLLSGGHSVQVKSRTEAHATSLAADLAGDRASVTGGPLEGAVDGDVVVLAVPYAAALEIAAARGADLAGKAVVDLSNPVDATTFDSLVTPPDSSAAEEVQKALPAGTPVVKAFNTVFASTLGMGSVAGRRLDVLLASDDARAKAAVHGLIEDGGMHPVDCGPLRRSRQLEQLGFLHMAIQESLRSNWASSVAFIY